MSFLRSRKMHLSAIAALGLLSLFFFFYEPLKYTPPSFARPASFEEFFNKKIKESKKAGVRPGNEERLFRISPKKTKYTILFIHGFGASRAEGELIVDKLARRYQANTYYLRLPGHGTNKEDHASHSWKEYLDTAEEAFAMMPFLGDKVVLVGSSTGGTIATWLAARHPKQVAALVLSSPFYGFGDPMALLLDIPGGLGLAKLVLGEDRDANDYSGRTQSGYKDHWLVDQKMQALDALAKLRRFVARKTVYQNVRAPVLLLYYYKDEENKDTVVSIEAIKEAFDAFGSLRPPEGKEFRSPKSRMVPVADGSHVLLSAYVRTDKKFVLREITAFLDGALLDRQNGILR